MSNKTSQHILNTSANLLGFCLIVITSLHMTNSTKGNLIDEFTSVIALLLTVSSFFSFLSIKSQNSKREQKLENIADNFFLISIIGILAIILFMVKTYWLI